MEENKSEQYTYGTEEKQILEILDAFERELQEKLQESKGEVERIKYYEKFQMQGIDFTNIFITTEKDVDGNISYHVYCGDNSKEIMSVDHEGQIKIIPELEEYLAGIDLNEMMEENEKDKKRLKGISEKTDLEELKNKMKKSDNPKDQEKENEQDEEEKEIEEDLEEQGTDLGITKIRGIKDKHFAERMPEMFENSTENKIAYSEKLHGFIILSKIDGKWQQNTNIQPTTTAWRRTTLSLDEDGNKIEKTTPYGLMRTNNPKKEIAVTIGQYGYIDIQTVDVLPCNERLARGVRTDGEGMKMEENYETRQNFKTEGIMYPHEVAHNAEKAIEDQQELTGNNKDSDITPDDYIPNTCRTWRSLMEETGESFTELVARYSREIESGKDEKQAIKTIEEDYENISHDKRRY